MSEQNTYIAPIVSIVTGVFTLLGVLLANRSNHKQLLTTLKNENDQLKDDIHRQRIEELFVSLEKWAGAMVIHHTTLRKVMVGELTYDQALDLQIEADKPDFDSHRLFMLAELYFPKCHDDLNKIKKYRDDASDLQHSYKILYKKSGANSTKHAAIITEILEKFNDSVDNYKKSLLKSYPLQ